jgi:uncharacterized membrane protein
MAAATKQRSSATRRRRGAAAAPTKKATQARKKAAERRNGPAKQAVDAIKPSAVKHPVRRVATAAALKAAKAVGRRVLDAAGDGIRTAAGKAAAAGKGAIDEGLSNRLPIQVSIDIAVPLEFAWEEWMTFDALTEGVHRIEDVEREGDRLYGETAPPLSAEWEAEIVDERECESFAWRSVKGSDCAGLVTFHRLSDRLTRIELDLDVLPTGPAETVALALHFAHRRATTELRRFKARLEFTNPDVYEMDTRRNGSGPHNQSDDKEA